jgi:hypothetical protein
MRAMFPGFYPPTDDEYKQLWSEGIFAFDANVLLNVYRYTPATRDGLFEVLRGLQDRIWLPHQAGLEYQERRLDVIEQAANEYERRQAVISEALEKLKTTVRSQARHAYLSEIDILPVLDRAIKQIRRLLDKQRKEHPDYLESDQLRETITTLFDGKVGDPFMRERRTQILERAKQRFEDKIPPGYEDSDKLGERVYGDVILWFQLLEHAKATKTPVVFVTDDRKEDWWIRRKGKIIGPRSELLHEMRSDAGVQFYMYPSDQFLEHAQAFLELQKQPAAIEEVREVLEESEAKRLRVTYGRPHRAVRPWVPRYVARLSDWPTNYGYATTATEIARQLADSPAYRLNRETLEAMQAHAKQLPTIDPSMVQAFLAAVRRASLSAPLQSPSENADQDGEDERDEADGVGE